MFYRALAFIFTLLDVSCYSCDCSAALKLNQGHHVICSAGNTDASGGLVSLRNNDVYLLRIEPL